MRKPAKKKLDVVRDKNGKFTSYAKLLGEVGREAEDNWAKSSFGNKTVVFPCSIPDGVIGSAQTTAVAPAVLRYCTGPTAEDVKEIKKEVWEPGGYAVNKYIEKRKFFSLPSVPTFERVLAYLAVVTAGLTAYLYSLEVSAVETRFEVLKWFLQHPHGNY